MERADFRKLQIRLLEQTYRYGKTHLGSSFSSLGILVEIFESMQPSDRFVLSNGHAASALYVVLEKFKGIDSSIYFETMGDHPKRDPKFFVDCSTGSLGMGITVAVGMALSNRARQVFCVVSDGECAEGSVWESLRFIKNHKIDNIQVYFNFNGWSAYGKVDITELSKEVRVFLPNSKIVETSMFPFESRGLQAHYLKMNEESYLQARGRI